MFDFEKLIAYQKAKKFNSYIQGGIIQKSHPTKTVRYQLSRASLSIMLNIAEGSGRFTPKDKKNFYVIARGSVFECVAVCDYLLDDSIISKEMYRAVYDQSEELSKILFSMIRKLENNS